MIKLENQLGNITISPDYFANLVGRAASECFGVAEMVVTTAKQGLRSFISKQDPPDKGVRVREAGDKLIIDLHIIVSYGVNVSAIVKSIVNRVRFVVEDATGLTVSKVNVFVDGMKADSDAAN